MAIIFLFCLGIKKAEKEDDVIYEIVFDKEFLGGIQLRSSPNRAYKMSWKNFINLSHGIRLQNNKAKNSASVPAQQGGY